MLYDIYVSIRIGILIFYLYAASRGPFIYHMW